jgi:hypothetical protein
MPAKNRYTTHVVRDIQWIVLAFLVAGVGVGACAEVDDLVHAGPVEDAAVVSYDSDPGIPYPCIDPGFESPRFRQADVLILLDRSGSMDTADGAGTRYQTVSTLLSNLVTDYAAHVRFGYQEMPDRQGCGTTPLAAGCCASPPLVGIADGNVQQMTAAIASALPMDGDTPTAASLQAALVYFATLADGIDNRYVLLVTDGAPNCTGAGLLSSGADVTSAACADALFQVNALVALGVRVMVVGVGQGLMDGTSGDIACLDALAHAGGAASSPGSPGFFFAGDNLQLNMAIEQVFGGSPRPSCFVIFRRPILDTTNLGVYFDGKAIPQGLRDGWQIDSLKNPQGVIINGKYCDQIQQFQVTDVDVGYWCPRCLEGQGCE